MKTPYKMHAYNYNINVHMYCNQDVHIVRIDQKYYGFFIKFCSKNSNLTVDFTQKAILNPSI